MNEELTEIQQLADRLTTTLIDRSPQLIAAVAILIVGFITASFIARIVRNICTKRSIDITLTRFFASSIKVMVLALFAVIAINKIGVEMAPFIALFGASAFGISLAVQGPISNYGAGIVLIITRPFKVDDTLTIHGLTGLVTSINLGFSQLMTEDGQEITIPNRKILGEILTNSFDYLVVEGVVGIDYQSDPEAAIAAIEAALPNIKGIAADKDPQVGIEAFGDSSINIGYRYWVRTKTYYSIQYAANLAIFKALKQAGIAIPFPQRDVRIVSDAR